MLSPRSFPKIACSWWIPTTRSRAAYPNAITVARELERTGHRLAGIRIDSGDLAFLSQRARDLLDDAGLGYVKIVASNELDEFVIAEVISQGGKVDIWGVGTNLVVGAGPGGCALGGIYKLVEHNGVPKIKLSGNPEKMTNPGVKKVVRFYKGDLMEADALAERSEDVSREGVLIIDPNESAPPQRAEHGARALICWRMSCAPANSFTGFPGLTTRSATGARSSWHTCTRATSDCTTHTNTKSE